MLAAADAGAAAPWRGIYTESGAERLFQPCGGGTRLNVSGGSAKDDLGSIYSVLAARGGGRVYVELRGRRRGNALHVAALERVQPGAAGCAEVLRNTLFNAFGTSPDWNVYIDPAGIRLRTLADGLLPAFPYRRYRRQGEAWVFDTANANGILRVELHRLRCIDADSGGRFGFSAEVSHGERKFSGCAYAGALFRD